MKWNSCIIFTLFSLGKPWFWSPTNKDEKVFTFFDAPHLLKLIRNHYLNSGLIFNTILSPLTISDILGLTSTTDISIPFMLGEEYISGKVSITVRRFLLIKKYINTLKIILILGRQKVKLAAQLFSNTTDNAIWRCYSLGMDIYQPIESAEFIQQVKDWFDFWILNWIISHILERVFFFCAIFIDSKYISFHFM